jgi:serine/threonine-protein kinase HipA
MTSDLTFNATGQDEEATHAFVWVWLPGAKDAVPAGRIDLQERSTLVFTYGRRYLDRSDAVSLFLPELPLVPGPQIPFTSSVAGCIRDAAPDGWGQRVIENRLARTSSRTGEFGLLTYLLESGSNRIGALDFQLSATEYVRRGQPGATVADLIASADRVEAGEPLSPELDAALLHGTSIGGARPKAVLVDGDKHLIAKFSSRADTVPVVQFEFVGMELARRSGVTTAPVQLINVAGRQTLLVERFDRLGTDHRRSMVSALTVLGLDERGARHASYVDLADQIRFRFTDPEFTLHELFSRLVFNIIIGNTDDHARNHAAFWDGAQLSLTPAYDISPWLRSGGETSQAMSFDRNGARLANLDLCVATAKDFHLDVRAANEIIAHHVEMIGQHWDEVCDIAQLGEVERLRLRNSAVLHPSIFYKA